ncbi:phage tail tape measure protein [Pseudomonas beijingensis]|uniref:phage tail tape measure protein n=1 Tax=Pseudomonas beijingensis TaxID=2954101 RepID=UPI002733EFA6|nr:phage tail tape measure protein [Pseudomonas sp. FP830]WLI47916.1 phage tail tape measure protein [Pseudomonas sp. FP830]
MANDLKLQVLLNAIDKASGPLKAINNGSIGAARALKEARDRLKELNTQQKDVSAWRTQRAAAEQTEQSLLAARDKVRALSQQFAATGAPTKAMTKDFRAAVREAQKLKEQHQQQGEQLQVLRSKLQGAGISTKNLSSHERQLREQISATNASISEQGKRLVALNAQQKRLAIERAKLEKTQNLAGNMAMNGAAGLGVGYAASRPVAKAIGAFAPNEDSATQLRVSMMDGTGKVSEDFQKITDLATKLGDRLPGTTADFQEMMTMLRRQGLSAKSILGGTGEAAAYLGVQLQMPVTAAAEFAAKMQDATRTSEKDMMSLMDIIQRGFYSGVQPTNMLQGFSKIAPVMDTIKKSGIDAAAELAPLLIMMDQAGMDGGAAGNAFRKIFQAGLNKDGVKDVNKIMELEGKPIRFKFTDNKGNFAGLENLFAQVEKLKTLNDEDRTTTIKDLFGDDSETMTTLNTMMSKGLDGYREIQQKLQNQADLRKRVNEQLGTLTNVMEAAQGSWTNAMAEFGAAVAPELKEVIQTLGEVANNVGAWARENPKLAGGLVKVVAAVAGLAFVFGGLALTMASLLGPFAMVRYGMGMFGIRLGLVKTQLLATRTATAGASANIGRLGKVWRSLVATRSAGGLLSALPAFVSSARLAAASVLPMLGGAISAVGTAIMATPIGWLLAAIAALVAAGVLVYKYWNPIKGFFLGFWQGLVGALQPVLDSFAGLGQSLLNLGQAVMTLPGVGAAMELLGSVARPLFSLISDGVSSLITWFGQLLAPVEDVGGAAQSMGERFGAVIGNMLSLLLGLPAQFAELGTQMIQGLANGITNSLTVAKEVITGAGDAVIGWFKEKLDIHSPSRVFAELGGFTMAGLAQGLEGSQNGPLSAMTSLSKQLTAAGTLALGATAMPLAAMPLPQFPVGAAAASSLSIDDRAPISPAPAPVHDSHDTYEINIHTTPGMDAQAISRAVRAELARIASEKAARQRSKLSDLE